MMQDRRTNQALKSKNSKRKKCAYGEFQISTCPASTPLWRLIPLTQGLFAIVDAKNYEWLNQWKWYAHWRKRMRRFYALRKSKKENGKSFTVSMARQILGLNYGDKRQSDHINHNTLDNRVLNLRVATIQQNQWNQQNPKGYYWNKSCKKFEANIKLNCKTIYLGRFHTAKEAHNVYLEAKKQYHNF